jgi:hypothetical protein
MKTTTVTFEVGSAKITVPTDELFRAWLDRHINQPAAGLVLPAARPGERYVGGIINPNGTVRHIFLLPGDSDRKSWKEQMAWAESVGGELLDRVVGALLFATMRDEFKEEAYWTCETHAANSNYAWFQDFGGGSQYDCGKSYELRARAVRSVTI